MRRDELLLTKGSRQAAMQQHHQHKDWSTRVPTKHKHKSAHKGSAASNCRLRRLVLSGPQLCDPGHVALFANAQVYNFESLFAQLDSENITTVSSNKEERGKLGRG